MNKKRIAVFQSNYIPWKGYFDLIRAVDEFVLDDDVQYTKQSWRNRNRIKTADGLHWLTIPLRTTFPQKIREVKIADASWPSKHWRAIESSYHKAPAFADFGPYLRQLYQTADGELLSAVNEHFLRGLCEWMEITTPIVRSTQLHVRGERNERIIAICQALAAGRLLNGPSAKNHMDESRFREAGLQVDYAQYELYTPYPQLFGEFAHQVSVIDLLMNCGRDFHKYLVTW